MKRFIACFLFIVTAFHLASALRDPAAVYCEALNYTYSEGKCILPDGTIVDAWSFLLGKIGQKYSYCAKQGYELKIISDPEECSLFLTESCAGCVLPNGSVIEVTKLMGLSFRETVCGDNICGFPENYKNCPQDCPSGSADGYCDGIADGKCDPDCILQNVSFKDPDCPFCGNGKCEAGEDYKNCCQDCGCPKLMKCQNNTCVNTCGNGVCEAEYGEDYKTCPLDCYKPNYLLFASIIIGFFLLSLAFYYLLKKVKLSSE